MKRKTAGILTALVCAFCLFTVPVQAKTETRAMDGVYIENIDVSGMNQSEVRRAMEKQMEKIQGELVDFYVGEQKVTVPLSELGIQCDFSEEEALALRIGQSGNMLQRYKLREELKKEPIVLELSFSVDEEKVRKILEEQCVPLNQEVVDMGLLRTQNGFEITGGKDGIELNLEKSLAHIRDWFAKEYHGGRAGILLPGEVKKAKGSEEELSKVQNLLGQSSTDFSNSSGDRRKNIAVGAQKINGTVLYPGEEFQMLPKVLPFNEENGYAQAPSYAMGNVVDTFGGGICQVSTTLYLAVLRAELEVTERHNHSMVVSYVKQAMDAAIAESAGKDFRFRNNTDAPIYIEAYAYKGTLAINIFGQETRPQNRKVSYVSEVLNTTEPEIKVSADPEAAAGTLECTQSPHTGYGAELWKVVTVDGKEESREKVNSSNYQMSPGVYKVGTKTENQEILSKLQAAIAENDLKKIRILINK